MRDLIVIQSDDRLNFTRATDLRSTYPWHAFEKATAVAAVAADAGHVRCLYSPRKTLLRMTDMPHVGKITRATLRKCPLWRNAYWWGDQSERSRPTDTQLHPRAVNAQRWQYTVTRAKWQHVVSRKIVTVGVRDSDNPISLYSFHAKY